jgi:GNAT superfamily N-acetyltransferase
MKNIILRPCCVADIFMSDLPELYARESAIQGMPAPKPDRAMYELLEQSGSLYCIGAFDDSRIIGLVAVLSHPLPHYGYMISAPESFFVHKDYRCTNAGIALLLAAEQRAKDTGSVGMLVTAPYGKELERIMDYMPGYKRSNTVFFKGIEHE